MAAPDLAVTSVILGRGMRGTDPVVVAVTVADGKLDFGSWEQIVCGEFDGRRWKRALVEIIGE